MVRQWNIGVSRETQKALKKLRSDGYLVDIVEKTIPKTHIKKDLFGFLDLLAIRPGQVLGIQVTSWSNISTRVKKILAHENLDIVLQSGIQVEVWAFKKGSMEPKIERIL